MSQIQTNRSKEERKGDGQGDDNRASNVPQEKEKDHDDQKHTLCEIVQHRVSRLMHQIVAIEIGDDLHPRGQNMVVEPFDHRVQAFQHSRGVCAFTKEHDPFDDVIVIVDHTVIPSGETASTLPSHDPK